jgi:hypothetical protein
MEFNFRWKIYWQSQYDNADASLLRARFAPVVEMISKKNSRNQADVALTLHFSQRKNYAGEQHLREMYRKSSGLETIF